MTKFGESRTLRTTNRTNISFVGVIIDIHIVFYSDHYQDQIF